MDEGFQDLTRESVPLFALSWKEKDRERFMRFICKPLPYPPLPGEGKMRMFPFQGREICSA